MANLAIQAQAQEINAVAKFESDLHNLLALLQKEDVSVMAPGTAYKIHKASGTLSTATVAEGALIPDSGIAMDDGTVVVLEFGKYRNLVPIEKIAKNGYSTAVGGSTRSMVKQAQGKVRKAIIDGMDATGIVEVEVAAATTFQARIAKAAGKVAAAFEDEVYSPIFFANTEDAFGYLGTANITVQTAFGLTYVENFMGYSALFLLPASQIARNVVIATPVENINLYYIDPSDSDFARLGLEYTTQGETNLIGFHAQGNYSTAVGESYALMGMALWAEYLDGIAVVYIGTETKVTSAETITADASDTHLFKTAHSPLLSVQELKDGSTAITNYTIERDGVRLASTPSGTVTIKYTYVA